MTDADWERWRGDIEARLTRIEKNNIMSGDELRDRGQQIRSAIGELKTIVEDNNKRIAAVEKVQEINHAMAKRNGTQIRWLIAGLSLFIAILGIILKIT